MSLTKLYLDATMDECINDTMDKCISVRKTRSKDDVTEDYISSEMIKVMFKTVLGKLNSEYSDMLGTKQEEHDREKGELEKKIKDVESSLTKKLNDALDIIDNIGQYTRRDNIKILGIPKTENENLPQIFTDVAKHNGVDMKEEHLSTIHRLNTRDDKEEPNVTNARGTNKKIPSMIARLTHRDTRNAVFNTRRQIKEKNGAPFPDAFIVEDVTPLRSRILYSLKNKLNQDGSKMFKFVWSRDGRIFARTEAESLRRDDRGNISQAKPHVINKVDDLKVLGWTNKEVDDIRYNVRA